MDGVPPPLRRRAVRRGARAALSGMARSRPASPGERLPASTRGMQTDARYRFKETPAPGTAAVSWHAADHHEEGLFGGERIPLVLRIGLLLLVVVSAVAGHERGRETRLAQGLGDRVHVGGWLFVGGEDVRPGFGRDRRLPHRPHL